jgi:hypothetical protein
LQTLCAQRLVAGGTSAGIIVVASGLVPLAFSLLVIAAALRLPSRLAQRYQHGIHALGERLHAGTHRHA